MWFDARAKLAEIAWDCPASKGPQTLDDRNPASCVAAVASVATFPAMKTEPKKPCVATVATPSAPDGDGPWRHGASVTGSPRTWTGRVVSLDAWRSLTEWERHGPNGRNWNGITRRWESP